MVVTSISRPCLFLITHSAFVSEVNSALLVKVEALHRFSRLIQLFSLTGLPLLPFASTQHPFLLLFSLLHKDFSMTPRTPLPFHSSRCSPFSGSQHIRPLCQGSPLTWTCFSTVLVQVVGGLSSFCPYFFLPALLPPSEPRNTFFYRWPPTHRSCPHRDG